MPIGPILNYIFRQISVAKDCHLYLNVLFNLITLLDNFGLNINYSEFRSVNLFPTIAKQKPENNKKSYYYIKIFYSENNDVFNIVENYIIKH